MTWEVFFLSVMLLRIKDTQGGSGFAPGNRFELGFEPGYHLGYRIIRRCIRFLRITPIKELQVNVRTGQTGSHGSAIGGFLEPF